VATQAADYQASVAENFPKPFFHLSPMLLGRDTHICFVATCLVRGNNWRSIANRQVVECATLTAPSTKRAATPGALTRGRGCDYVREGKSVIGQVHVSVVLAGVGGVCLGERKFGATTNGLVFPTVVVLVGVLSCPRACHNLAPVSWMRLRASKFGPKEPKPV